MNSNYEQTVKLWDETTETLNKLSYIAACTISLSITFLGYVLSMNPSVRWLLRLPFIHGMPIIDLLFLSWILLFLSLFFGIIIRLCNAKYLWNAHFNLWFKDMASKVTTESKPNYESIAKTAEKSRDKYWTLSKIVQWGTIGCFFLGIMTLLVFVVTISQELLNV